MPASLKDLRSRIKSVKNTQQITKAMKLVSAAKFGKAQLNVVNARPYTSLLLKLITKLLYFVRGGSSLSILEPNESKNALVLVVSSERGLCGGYNANIAKQAQRTFVELENQGFKPLITCIGKKAFQSILRKKRLDQKESQNTETVVLTEDMYPSNPHCLIEQGGLTLIGTSFEKLNTQHAELLAEAITSLYVSKKIGKVVVVYSKFQSAMTQIPTSETLLPLATSFASETENQAQNSLPEPIFDPELEELLSLAIPRYMTSRIFQLLLEARASEHGSRMTAMDNATRNAKEMERKLQITYQRARQAAITRELIEIISGAEAL